MKTFPVLIAAALASAVVSTSFANGAAAPSATVAESTITNPVPTHVVHPMNLPWSFQHATVKLAFVLDAKGIPHHVHPVGRIPADVASQVISAVSQWRFRPTLANGKPVSTHVVMPLTLVGEG